MRVLKIVLLVVLICITFLSCSQDDTVDCQCELITIQVKPGCSIESGREVSRQSINCQEERIIQVNDIGYEQIKCY